MDIAIGFDAAGGAEAGGWGADVVAGLEPDGRGADFVIIATAAFSAAEAGGRVGWIAGAHTGANPTKVGQDGAHSTILAGGVGPVAASIQIDGACEAHGPGLAVDGGACPRPVGGGHTAGADGFAGGETCRSFIERPVVTVEIDTQLVGATGRIFTRGGETRA